MSKIGRNDPCPCGSRRKYKDCHLLGGQQVVPTAGKVYHEMQKAWNYSKCLYPLSPKKQCGKPCIDSHTVQQSKALEALVDATKHVMTFYQAQKQPEGFVQPQPIGWNKASVLSLFCSTHDSSVFAPIEGKPYQGTPEQDFLYTYRAVHQEIYQKEAILRTSPDIPNMVMEALPKEARKMAQRKFDSSNAGIRHAVLLNKKLKRLMDKQLIEKKYDGWSRLAVQFTGHLSIATSGVITPSKTITGTPLQDLLDPNIKIEPLIVNITATEQGGLALMSWRTEHQAPAAFVDSLLSTNDKLCGYIAQTIFAYIENTYFSQSWWDSLKTLHKFHFSSLACIPNAYNFGFKYSEYVTMPWENISVARR